LAAVVVKVKAQSVAAETLRKVSGNKVTGYTACQGQDRGGSQYYLCTLSTQCLQYYLKFWPINLILKDLGGKTSQLFSEGLNRSSVAGLIDHWCLTVHQLRTSTLSMLHRGLNCLC
jgi:hypothetical protein